MIEVRSRLGTPTAPRGTAPQGLLRLPFELRQKSRLRARLETGEEVALDLPRGEILRGGDLLLAADGRIIEIVSQPEQVLHVECDTPEALARAAYHLGNRHVAVQVGEGWLRLAADHVLEHMLHGLGARTRLIEAPFEPEAGAYSGGHTHHGGHAHTHSHESHGGRIHEYGGHGHDHSHK